MDFSPAAYLTNSVGGIINYSGVAATRSQEILWLRR
jgi:hypothetical protein